LSAASCKKTKQAAEAPAISLRKPGERMARSTRTIYFDESGFTAYNLLDPNQPVFAVASADADERWAEEILADSFPNYQGAEFKFSNIWRSKNREGLIRFAQHLSALEDHSFLYVIDKRFAVLTKIVDFLIEPYVTDAGYDFYDKGFCWKYCNYIYFGLTQFAPPELLNALLRNYQAFSRDPTPQSLAKLRAQLKFMASSAEQRVRIFLEQMELGARLFHEYQNLEKFGGSDELQMTTMLAVVSYWRQHYPEDFAIVHDVSSNFLRSKELWERITSNKTPAQMHRQGDGTFVEFPLRIVSTAAVDSRNSRSIQLCDVLAGLATRHFSVPLDGDDRKFLNDLVGKGLKHVTHSGILPDVVFPDQIPPKRLTGPDVVDRMTEMMFGPHNENADAAK
jgi:hypothetical protein